MTCSVINLNSNSRAVVDSVSAGSRVVFVAPLSRGSSSVFCFLGFEGTLVGAFLLEDSPLAGLICVISASLAAILACNWRRSMFLLSFRVGVRIEGS